MGTWNLKLELPTWGCLSPRSCRPEQGSPPPVARGTAQRAIAHSRGAGDREGETPAASGRPRLAPVTGLPGLPNRSRPVRSPALRLCARPGRGTEGAPGRAADRPGTVSRPGGPGVRATGPQSSSRPRGPPHQGSRPGERGERAGRHSPGPLQSAHTSLLRSRFDMVPASPAGNPATAEAAAALPL